MNTLFLCRHGQSEWNKQGRLQGQRDNPLTELGKQQALTLADKARLWNVKNIYHSPLMRAVQTAQLCADKLHLQLVKIDELTERHYGCWQGQSIQQLVDYPGFLKMAYQDIHAQPCSGAESTQAVRKRMLLACQQALENSHSGNVMLISHGDAINCLLSLLTANLPAIQNGQWVAVNAQNKPWSIVAKV